MLMAFDFNKLPAWTGVESPSRPHRTVWIKIS